MTKALRHLGLVAILVAANVCAANGTVEDWGKVEPTITRITSDGRSYVRRGLGYAPTGDHIAYYRDERSGYVWDRGQKRQLIVQSRDGEQQYVVSRLGAVSTAAWSPDGKLLVSGSDDKTVRLWSVETGENLQTKTAAQGARLNPNWVSQLMGISPDWTILNMLPPAYWVGVALLSGATIVWFLSAKTRWYHFLLLLAWTLYIFIGPELVEVTARGFDAMDHLFGVRAIELGRWAEWDYGWPGFYFFSSFIYETTGIGFYGLAKLMAISLPLLRMVFIWYLASQLFREKRWTLLFSVLLLGSFWEGVSLDPSTQHLGLLLMLCLLALCFSTGQLGMRRRVLIVTLFAALVYTHVLSSFIMALVIVFFSLMSLTKRDFGYSRSISGYTLGTLCLVGFIAYLMYSVGWVFGDAVDVLIRALRDPFGAFLDPSVPFAYRSQYMAFSVNLIWLYYGIMLVWMFIIAARKEFWSKLTAEKIFPLLCLIPLLPMLLAYGGASLPRFSRTRSKITMVSLSE